MQVFGGISELPELMESSDFQNLVIPNGSRTPASADIHKSVRVEIFRGIRVIQSLLEKEVSRKARKGAKAQRRAIFFAPLRLCVKLALWNCRTIMCSDKYRHTCV